MKRSWISWLLAIAPVWIVVGHFADIKRMASILFQGVWTWILIAALFQFIYFLIHTAVYQVSFDAVQVKSRCRDLLPMVLAAVFVNVAVPSGGASGAALFVEDAAYRGQSAAKTAAGLLLVVIADMGSFLRMLALGLGYLVNQHDLKFYEALGAVFLLIFFAGVVGFLVIGLWKPGVLHRILAWAQQPWRLACDLCRQGLGGRRPGRLGRSGGRRGRSHPILSGVSRQG